MYPVVIGAIVLAVLVLAYYAWTHWISPRECTPAQLAKIGAKGMACTPSGDGKWLVFPGTFYNTPAPSDRKAITVKAGVYAADCQKLCNSEQGCVAWASGGGDNNYCYTFGALPTSMLKSADWTMGVSAAAAAAGA